MARDVVTLQQNQQLWIATLGPWKLVIGPGRSTDDCMLFETFSDPDERVDLSRRHPGIVHDLLARCGALAFEDTPLRLPIAC